MILIFDRKPIRNQNYRLFIMSFSSNELIHGIRTDNREPRDKATKKRRIQRPQHDSLHGDHEPEPIPMDAQEHLQSGKIFCTVKTTVFNKRHNLISILHYQAARIHYLFMTLPAGSMLINNKLITL